MRILYAIQGTGNGHMARAFEIIPELQKYGTVDIAVSGIQTDINLPWPVKYRLYGLSFVFGKKGGVDLASTLKKTRLFRFIKDLFSIPVNQYDIIFNDFEPVVAWACKLQGKKCIGISHQSAVLHPDAPKPDKSDWFGKAILNCYAPVKHYMGFHFKSIGKNITTPVIRSDIRHAEKSTKGHYTVYLPSYSDEKIMKILSQIKYIQWEVFSKHNKKPIQHENISIQPVDKEKFTGSFLSCTGILCNAGFETPAEALYLGKKLCVVPMKGQFEQQCNAAFLKSIGITTLNDFEKEVEIINEWVFFEKAKSIRYPDNVADVIEEIINTFSIQYDSLPQMAINSQFKI